MAAASLAAKEAQFQEQLRITDSPSLAPFSVTSVSGLLESRRCVPGTPRGSLPGSQTSSQRRGTATPEKVDKSAINLLGEVRGEHLLRP